ncbi:MAG: HAMP domain-containing histidine kinase [Ruminococcaceae bacterium]|nr:HAMP domain-containing histidine kinase [Oscillospiraceae bacterium]
MFKSVFAKYITAFILIIFISFSMMLSIIVSLVNNYSVNIRSEIVKSAARSAESYLTLRFEEADSYDLRDFVLENYTDVNNIMESVAKKCDGVSLMLADRSGNLILYAHPEKSGYFQTPIFLPADMHELLLDKQDARSVGTLSGVFESAYISYATPMLDDEANYCGSVIASTSGSSVETLLNKMIKTIFISSLWILIAVLIAVYFITEMITGPLREMNKAAKKFGSGRFDIRVPVRGNDEVAELAKAFNDMATSLDNFENTRNTFMANVAHDLRTPMTTISGFIDNILIGAIPKENEAYYLGIIKEEIKRLSRLVSSLLDITRLQAGDRKLVMADFDICELARLILISFEQKIDSKKLNVEFDCEEERMTVNADRDAIYQILYNICDNGVKFARNGGDYRIRIQNADKKKILVSVYNTGEGISPDDLPHIFERFYKADKSRGVDKNGVGLGMYISRTIIEAHGEKIWVESKHHQFSEFFFTLPKGSQN